MNNTTEQVLLNFVNGTLIKVLDNEEDPSSTNPLFYILPSVSFLVLGILIVLGISYQLMQPRKHHWCCCLKCCKPSEQPLQYTYNPTSEKEGPTFYVKSSDPYRTTSTAVDALPQTIEGPIFPAPDIFYDIDLNPKEEEEVDGIKRQESLTQRCAKIIQARAKSLRNTSILNETSLANENFRLDADDIDTSRKAWARDSFDPALLQNEPGLLKVRQGDLLTILKDGITNGYTQVMNSKGETGFVPTTILHF